MKNIKSPCNGYCSLDRNDICKGCKRTISEIKNWGGFTNQEKLEVYERIRKR